MRIEIAAEKKRQNFGLEPGEDLRGGNASFSYEKAGRLDRPAFCVD